MNQKKDKKSIRGSNSKSLANLIPAKKGEVRNPTGISSNPVVRALKHWSREEYARGIQRAIMGDKDDLIAMTATDQPAFVQLLGGCLLQAIEKKNYALLDQMASRLIGSIPIEVKSTSLTVDASNPDLVRQIIDELKKDV